MASDINQDHIRDVRDDAVRLVNELHDVCRTAARIANVLGESGFKGLDKHNKTTEKKAKGRRKTRKSTGVRYSSCSPSPY